ncbi:MAG: hypothetical protein H0U54_13300 [Acidobacteria bacterium]|nr:hypothetical protein [Acidobacteriota bacterium]
MFDRPEKAVNTDAEEPGCDARVSILIAYLGTACEGDGRARIPPLTVLAEVIVGQGLKPRKNKRRSWCST